MTQFNNKKIHFSFNLPHVSIQIFKTKIRTDDTELSTIIALSIGFLAAKFFTETELTICLIAKNCKTKISLTSRK